MVEVKQAIQLSSALVIVSYLLLNSQSMQLCKFLSKQCKAGKW